MVLCMALSLCAWCHAWWHEAVHGGTKLCKTKQWCESLQHCLVMQTFAPALLLSDAMEQMQIKNSVLQEQAPAVHSRAPPDSHTVHSSNELYGKGQKWVCEGCFRRSKGVYPPGA